VNGSAVAVNWEKENIPAIVEAWYGGQEAGNAIADVLVGNYNPSGRLPVTFYISEKQLPDFENYDMQGRTYRYFPQQPLFEFGYGLSYTSFAYSNLQVSNATTTSDKIIVKAEVKNTGNRDGEEVVQLYLNNPDALKHGERYALKAFNRIALKKGETRTVTLELKPEDFSVISDEGKKEVKPGVFTVFVGGRQPVKEALDNKQVLSRQIILAGEMQTLKL
jgi:beta-glucosidase